jgi:quinol monooxygenase YgiN
MSTTGTLYTVGTWKVIAGKEGAFIEAWREFALWTAQHVPGTGVGRLLQDASDPTRFMSFGSWEDVDAAQHWRQLPEFKAFFVKARGMCEDIVPQTLLEVATTATG